VLVSQQLPRLPNFKLDRIGLLHWVESAVKESHGTSVQQEGVFPVGELPSVPPMALEILREWERVLGRKLEGIHTAWRTTGGDSLQALEVLSAVERRMGRRLTTAMIHADATPASMAGELLTADPLQNEVAHATSRVPGKLWVISSLASVSVHDRRLIELLADVVDGDVLHITSIDDELQRLRSIRQLAEDCVATLIARTGLTTPVHLMGLSFGARVAFEMAGVLRERGVEVGFMGIGDIPMDARATRVENGRGGEGTLGKSVRGSGGRRLQKARDTAKSIAIDGVEWLAAHRHEWLLRWYIRWGRAVLGEGFTILSNLALRRGQAVGWNPGFFDGEVTLFVSADRGKSLIRLSPTLGWERHATSVHRVDVAGSHENYHRDEHAAGLTAEIRARLLSTHASCQVDSIPTACVRG
jgi:thioesterase domain-containing protein